MKKVAVIGGMGNMGRRYALILKKYCDCEVVVWDLKMGASNIKLDDCDGFIIATPTDTHYTMIRVFMLYGKPILCEKPVITNQEKFRTLLSFESLDLSMINQYEFLVDEHGEGHTQYNYFKTGGDSLLWDCMNIIGLAKTTHEVSNDSLIWSCTINGQELSIRDIDMSYIDNIVAWTKGWRNKEYLIHAHEKVWGLLYAKESK